MFRYIDFARSPGGVEAACERIPSIPAIYAFFRRLPDLSRADPSTFARQIEELIEMPAAPHHVSQAGPLHRVSLEARSQLSAFKRAALADLSQDAAFRSHLSEILQHITLLQAPLYIGKAQALQA